MGSERSIAGIGATLVGAVYLVLGIVGFFITGFSNFTQDVGHNLLGFDLTPFHNVIHLGIGFYFLLVPRFGDHRITEGALIGGGLVYLLAAFLGFDERLQILAINSASAPDNYLHVASGLAALVIGLVSTASTSRSQRAAY